VADWVVMGWVLIFLLGLGLTPSYCFWLQRPHIRWRGPTRCTRLLGDEGYDVPSEATLSSVPYMLEGALSELKTLVNQRDRSGVKGKSPRLLLSGALALWESCGASGQLNAVH
jgi:hypothetical protein